jgi:hypothetical protein
MEIRVLKTNRNQLVVTGLSGIGLQEFGSVLKQLLDRTDINGETRFVFPEMTSPQKTFGYFEISNDSTWHNLWEQLPSTRVPVVRASEDLSALEISDWTRQMQTFGDSFLHTNWTEVEKEAERKNLEEANKMKVTMITTGVNPE